MQKTSNLLILFTLFLFTLNADYPLIEPDYNNNLYKQAQTDINENSRRLSQNKELLPIQFFKYKIRDNDTIFTVSSRFNLTYDTIATLNSIDNQLFFTSHDTVIIPTCSGIFNVYKKDENSKDLIINGIKYYFHPGKSFSNKERLNFLVTPFSSPLKKMEITSSYGYRENPFTGIKEFHSGLDLKAKSGTKIYSPYSGTIKDTGYSDFFGNYLVIKHPNGYSSHYYHLKKIYKKQNSKISKGDLVAQTGNSGKSTGPHLHFEIRLNDETINPSRLLGNI